MTEGSEESLYLRTSLPRVQPNKANKLPLFCLPNHSPHPKSDCFGSCQSHFSSESTKETGSLRVPEGQEASGMPLEEQAGTNTCPSIFFRQEEEHKQASNSMYTLLFNKKFTEQFTGKK